MSTTPRSNSDLDQLDEEIVAYLDGELEPAAARKFEDRLSTDAVARRRLNQLAASWDLLDQLPRAAVDDGFARTTVEMVALAVESDIAQAASAAPDRRRRLWLAGGAAALVAALCGFVAIYLSVPDRNDRLLRDLPLVQNFDAYQQVQTIGLARMLDSEQLFAERQEAAPASSSADPALNRAIPDSIDARREWVEALPSTEKADLRRNFEKFTALPADQQAAIRSLDDEIRADPQAAALIRAIQRYHQWLKTRSPAERLELADQSDSKLKLAAIARMKDQDSRTFNRMFNRADFFSPTAGISPTALWLFNFADAHQTELLNSLPQNRRDEIEKLEDRWRRQRLAFVAWQRWWSPRATETPPLTEAELKSLSEHLPPEWQQKLAAAADTSAKVAVIRDWVRADFRRRAAAAGGGPNADRRRRPLDEMSPEERQQTLDRDPADAVNPRPISPGPRQREREGSPSPAIQSPPDQSPAAQPPAAESPATESPSAKADG